MRKGDAGAAAAFLLVSAVVLVDSAGYPPSLVPGAPSAAFFPRLLALALAGLSGALLVGALRRGGPREDAHEGPPSGPAGLRRVGLTLLVLALAAFLLPRVDVFLVLPVLLFGLMWIAGERRWALLVGVPLAFDAFAYGVFYRLFGVQLPTLFG